MVLLLLCLISLVSSPGIAGGISPRSSFKKLTGRGHPEERCLGLKKVFYKGLLIPALKGEAFRPLNPHFGNSYV